MHAFRITSVIISDINRDTFTKISFKTVNTNIQYRLQLICIPLYRSRIGEIHQCHARLPVINLLYPMSVCTHQKIPACCAFCKEVCILGNIGIDPCTDLHSLIMIALHHCLYITKLILIPLKITPMQCTHPVTVKVENAQRNIAIEHTIDQTGYCFFIITWFE